MSDKPKPKAKFEWSSKWTGPPSKNAECLIEHVKRRKGQER